MPKIWIRAENFVRRISLSQPHLMLEKMIEKRITVKQSSKQKFGGQTFSADKTAEISTGAENFVRRKILSAGNFVRRNFVR